MASTTSPPISVETGGAHDPMPQADVKKSPSSDAASLFDEDALIIDAQAHHAALRRLSRQVRFSDAELCEFTPADLPVGAVWDGLFYDPPVLAMDSNPVTLRIFGTVVTIECIPAIGGFPPLISVELALLRSVDHHVLVQLLRDANPMLAREPSHITVERFIRGVNEYFREIYDGTSLLRPKEFLSRLKVSDINPGDVVLAECVAMMEPLNGGGAEVAFEIATIFLLSHSET
ncbi:hypothetical protein C8Q79DRAFT_1005973 [Trametes meyenii]|nr:hypothetical protein C8Q79DRAFT_1005973 [Trametes meyenii]